MAYQENYVIDSLIVGCDIVKFLKTKNYQASTFLPNGGQQQGGYKISRVETDGYEMQGNQWLDDIEKDLELKN